MMTTATLTKECARCGVAFSKPRSCGMPEWTQTRKYCSRECQLAMTLKAPGKSTWNKDMKGYSSDLPRGEEWRRKMSAAQKGRPQPHRRGENHHNWKGGISAHRRDLRDLRYVQWREAVFARDDFTCLLCGVRGGDLEAHHIERWSENEDLRFEVDNGATLCRRCHRKTKGREELFAEPLRMIAYTRT